MQMRALLTAAEEGSKTSNTIITMLLLAAMVVGAGMLLKGFRFKLTFMNVVSGIAVVAIGVLVVTTMMKLF